MADELRILAYAVLFAGAHFVVFAIVANVELGTTYTLGPRDAPPDGLSVRGQRLRRAYANYLETLPIFAIAMVVAHLAMKADAVVIAAGWTYLAARLVYPVAYVFAVPYLRSTVWAIATTAIFVIAIRALV